MRGLDRTARPDRMRLAQGELTSPCLRALARQFVDIVLLEERLLGPETEQLVNLHRRLLQTKFDFIHQAHVSHLLLEYILAQDTPPHSRPSCGPCHLATEQPRPG